MTALAHLLFADRRLPFRALRIALLATLGWWLAGPWLVETVALARVSPELMQLQWATDFSRRSVRLMR